MSHVEQVERKAAEPIVLTKHDLDALKRTVFDAETEELKRVAAYKQGGGVLMDLDDAGRTPTQNWLGKVKALVAAQSNTKTMDTYTELKFAVTGIDIPETIAGMHARERLLAAMDNAVNINHGIKQRSAA